MMIKGESCRAKDLFTFFESAYGKDFWKEYSLKTNKPYDKGTMLIHNASGVSVIETERNGLMEDVVTAPDFDLDKCVEKAIYKRGSLGLTASAPNRRENMTKDRLRQINDNLATVAELWMGEGVRLTFNAKTGKMEAKYGRKRKNRKKS